jgi:ferric-dicitrate binding protein FerR (iron transport regulator)
MMDYANFDASGFASDEKFLLWVKHPDKDQNAFWAKWLDDHPHKKAEVEEARRMILAVLSDNHNFPAAHEKEVLWSRIETGLDGEKTGRRVPGIMKWSLAAATSALCVVAAFLFFRQPSHEATISDASVEDGGSVVMINNEVKPLTLILADGSSIILQSGSSLRYPKIFQPEKREVYLEGQAFFEIVKDSQRPFFVYANHLITQVLGTSFSIRAYDNEPDVTVEVMSGRVSVFPRQNDSDPGDNNPRKEGLVLTPNQQAVYKKEDAKLVKSLFENPSLLSPKEKQVNFEFADARMKDVFDALEAAYGIEIIYDEDVMKNCLLNASLTHESLQVKLTLICKAVNATYEIMDTHIIIYGKGCTE